MSPDHKHKNGEFLGQILAGIIGVALWVLYYYTLGQIFIR